MSVPMAEATIQKLYKAAAKASKKQRSWEYARLMYRQGKMSLKQVAEMMGVGIETASQNLGIWY